MTKEADLKRDAILQDLKTLAEKARADGYVIEAQLQGTPYQVGPVVIVREKSAEEKLKEIEDKDEKVEEPAKGEKPLKGEKV